MLRIRVPRGVEVYEVNGPFFFGAAATFKDTLARVAGKPQVLIVRLRRVPVLDATALHTLADVVHRSRADGTLVLLAEVQPQPMTTIRTSSVLEEIGEEHLCESIEEALARAAEEVETRRLLRVTGSQEAVRQ